MLVLEWSDPPFNAGHWVPDMVEAAGGVPVLAVAGAARGVLCGRRSCLGPIDLTVFMPCGFDLEGAVGQASKLLSRPDAAGLGSIFAVDANAYFSRPGPRVVDGVELLAGLLHPPAGGGCRPDSPVAIFGWSTTLTGTPRGGRVGDYGQIMDNCPDHQKMRSMGLLLGVLLEVHERHDGGRLRQLDAQLRHDRSQVGQELVESLLALPDIEDLKLAILTET